ncbi:MAG: hypothetical protein ABL900_05515 [Burkholderiaceae bacterium]
MAHVLAMVMATQAELDPRAVRMLEELDAFRRIGLTKPAFLRIVREYRDGACKALSGHDHLQWDDMKAIDPILDEIHDAAQRLHLCRLAGCLIATDGHITDVERGVYDRMLTRWGYTPSSLAQAIL